MKELTQELAKKREIWLEAIRALSSEGFVISDLTDSRLSPQFNCGSWRIGAEHTRQFRSVVLRWLGEIGSIPSPPADATICPSSDIKKNWQFRIEINPNKLENLIKQLNSPSMP